MRLIEGLLGLLVAAFVLAIALGAITGFIGNIMVDCALMTGGGVFGAITIAAYNNRRRTPPQAEETDRYMAAFYAAVSGGFFLSSAAYRLFLMALPHIRQVIGV